MKIAVFWHRRDLRLEDNAGLYHALRSGLPVVCLFIFDREILGRLADRSDARVTFIHDAVATLRADLQRLGSDLWVGHGNVVDVWETLLDAHAVGEVHANRDYETSAIARDQAVTALLQQRGIAMHLHKDHLIFEGHEVLKDDGKPYTVFTPYSKKWRTKLESRLLADGSSFYLQAYPTMQYKEHFLQTPPFAAATPTLRDMGFERSPIALPSKTVAAGLIKTYDQTRDFPGIKGTSRLGIHFRFGTVSIREKASKANVLNQTYLNELIWRDFYSQILQHFPYVADGPFKTQYAGIAWRNDEQEFAAWCAGRTGYPIVDAGMRELNATGFMHNRVRMIVASFLCKHLLIDWRWGEAYFAKKLLDFDLASNNGGWQWAAGCGTDAAPYFRIFSPDAQQARFDGKLAYTRHWVPELGTAAYPKPIVDHRMARTRCLDVYGKGIADKEV